MKKKKELKDIDCSFAEHCTVEHCEAHEDRGEVCSDCEHYRFWDSANGYCYGHPPELVTRWSWKRFRLVHTYETRIVPWCMVKCGLFKMRELKHENKKR